MHGTVRKTIWVNRKDPSEVITSEKEKEQYIKNQVAENWGEDDFYEWLDNNFCACTIYQMTEEERQALEIEFEQVCVENAKRYLEKEQRYFEQDFVPVEIEIEV